MKKRTFKSIVVNSLVFRDSETVAIGIFNPPVNALSLSVRNELRIALEDLDSRRGVGGITICGIGKHFSAGADLYELQRIAHTKSLSDKEKAAFAFARRGQHLVKQVLAMRERVEITAEIHGACTGGGFELALACSKRVIKNGLIAGLPEVTLGLIPGWGGTVLLPRALFTNGESHHFARRSACNSLQRATARKLIETGKLFTHTEALENFGVAVKSEIVIEIPNVALPPERLISLYARSLILEAIPVCDDSTSLEDMFLREAELFAKAMTHPEAREGIDAFLEKRVSRFLATTC